MPHTPHELAADLPELPPKIRELKAADPQFARMAAEYHEVNREIHRIETDITPASYTVQAELRRKRMALKDDLYARLRAAG